MTKVYTMNVHRCHTVGADEAHVSGVRARGVGGEGARDKFPSRGRATHNDHRRGP